MMISIKRFGLCARQALAMTLLAGTGLATPALAQVYYAHPSRPPTVDFFSPYDESYGTSPSYEIQTTPDPYGPVARVVERCQYPNGWNVTDFGRDINGIPNGVEHTCPAPVYGARLRARY